VVRVEPDGGRPQTAEKDRVMPVNQSSLIDAEVVSSAESERQTAELDAMRRMIEAASGCFSLSVAVCNSPSLRTFLVEQLQKSSAGLRVVEIPRGTVDVYGLVAAKVPDPPLDGLFVVNLEESVPSDADAQRTLRSLNASRELWEQRYSCPLVFWLPEYAATLLAMHAPDFWRYRSHRFDFVSEHAGAIQGLADSFAGSSSAAASLSAVEKRFRIAELEQRIAEAGDPPQPELALHVSIWLGEVAFLYQYLGDLDHAEEMLRKSLAICERLGWQEGVAGGYNNLGVIYHTRGDLGRAEEMHRKSLAVEEKLDRQGGMATDYGNLGMIYQTRGDLDRAEELTCKSLAINEKLGRQDGMASDYGSLGMIHQARGELDCAEEMHRKSLTIHVEFGQQSGIATDYGNLSVVYQTRGDLDRAEEMVRKSLAIDEKGGRQEGVASDYGLLGAILLKRGDLEESKVCLAKALDIFARIGATAKAEKTRNLLQTLQRNEEAHH
jgi:tetratricopeptide (TPR) repeat protein